MRHDSLIALALLAFAGLAWFWLIPGYAGGTGEQTYLPKVAVALIALLSLVLLALSWTGGGAVAEARAQEDPFLEVDRGGEPPRLVLLALIWGVHLNVLWVFGFYLGSILAVGASLVVLGLRRPLPLALWTVVPVAVLFATFEYGFALRLPRGALVSGLLALV